MHVHALCLIRVYVICAIPKEVRIVRQMNQMKKVLSRHGLFDKLKHMKAPKHIEIYVRIDVKLVKS